MPLVLASVGVAAIDAIAKQRLVSLSRKIQVPTCLRERCPPINRSATSLSLRSRADPRPGPPARPLYPHPINRGASSLNSRPRAGTGLGTSARPLYPHPDQSRTSNADAGAPRRWLRFALIGALVLVGFSCVTSSPCVFLSVLPPVQKKVIRSKPSLDESSVLSITVGWHDGQFTTVPPAGGGAGTRTDLKLRHRAQKNSFGFCLALLKYVSVTVEKGTHRSAESQCIGRKRQAK